MQTFQVVYPTLLETFQIVGYTGPIFPPHATCHPSATANRSIPCETKLSCTLTRNSLTFQGP